MFKIHPEIPESLSLEAKSFILRCFEPDPHKRAIASDLLRDTFVRHNKGKKSKIAFKPSGRRLSTCPHVRTSTHLVICFYGMQRWMENSGQLGST